MVVKDGVTYRDRAYLDGYHQVHEFLEVGYKHEEVF